MSLLLLSAGAPAAVNAKTFLSNSFFTKSRGFPSSSDTTNVNAEKRFSAPSFLVSSRIHSSSSSIRTASLRKNGEHKLHKLLSKLSHQSDCVQASVTPNRKNGNQNVRKRYGPFSPNASRMESETELEEEDASSVIKAFYDSINRRDIEASMDFIAEDCVYEDMIYSKPFKGRMAIKAHFVNVLNTLPSDVDFVIDDATGDKFSTGLIWHVELQGSTLPFSNGCSFYKCVQEKDRIKIIYARDIPEPSTKLGGIALVVLKYLVLLLKSLPQTKPNS